MIFFHRGPYHFEKDGVCRLIQDNDLTLAVALSQEQQRQGDECEQAERGQAGREKEAGLANARQVFAFDHCHRYAHFAASTVAMKMSRSEAATISKRLTRTPVASARSRSSCPSAPSLRLTFV